MHILTLNAGSSSIRFAIYAPGEMPILEGKLDRIGLPGATLSADGQSHAVASKTPVDFLLDWLEAQPAFDLVDAVGHRVVHGMHHCEPARVTPKLLAELRRIAPLDPAHLLREIALIEAIQARHPKLPQIACFDTAFHRTMPRVAKLIAIPHRFALERYGFHGLSYAYLMEELARLNPPEAKGRVILAHLGSGASLAAVHKGKSVDTSMGFTPAAGLVMGTRSGDLDPGIAFYLARTRNITAARFQKMVNHESGLLGVSGISSDLRDLTPRESTDPRANDAVALFCYQARKWIGSFAAVLGGVDTLVFSAGIGENSPAIRARICESLGFLGIRLSKPRNARNAALISTDSGPVKVRVIRTAEERMIARSVSRVLNRRPV